MKTKISILYVFLMAWLCVVTVAEADEPADGDRKRTTGEAHTQAADETALIDLAKKHFDAGDYERSADFLYEAYEVGGRHATLYKIGQAELSAKRFGPALEAFQRYLDEGAQSVSPAKREAVLEDIGNLQQLVGYVTVEAAPGCTVILEGVRRGATPLARQMAVTAKVVQQLEILDKGRKIFTKTLVLRVRETVRVDASIETEKARREMSDEKPVPVKATAAAGKRDATPARDVALDQLYSHTVRQQASRLMAINFMAIGVTMGLSSIPFFVNDTRQDNIVAVFLPCMGGFLSAVSVGALSAQGYQKRKALALREKGVSFPHAYEAALLEDNRYDHLIMGWMFFILGLGITGAGVPCLAVAYARDDGLMGNASWAATIPGVSLLTVSMVNFAMAARRKRQLEAMTAPPRASAAPPLALIVPVVAPVRRGGIVGLTGTF